MELARQGIQALPTSSLPSTYLIESRRLLFNDALLGDGSHEVIAFDGGVEFGRATFLVKTLEASFVNLPPVSCFLPDQPESGQAVSLTWQRGTNSITRSSPGVYSVLLPNMGHLGETTSIGVAHVIAFDNRGYRKVGGPLAVAGAHATIPVRCFDDSRVPTDLRYTLFFTRRTRRFGPLAQLDLDAIPATSIPASPRQFSSTGALGSIERLDGGWYLVTFPGLGTSSGTVKVTSVGTDSTHCGIEVWGPSGGSESVRIQCLAPTGTRVDRGFSLAFADKSPLGQIQSRFGYVFANQPTVEGGQGTQRECPAESAQYSISRRGCSAGSTASREW